ncbi:MAG: stalk domain-containing protein [Candidatus Cryosericum sp.]
MRGNPKLHALAVIMLVLGLLSPTSATGSSSATVITLWIGNPIMSIGTTQQPIDAEGTKPVIVENRTLVPIRAVIEAFGGLIEWDSVTRRVMVVLGDNVLDLWIGKSNASLNGTSLPVDAANPRVIPVIMSGRTMLPLRFVSESLGIDVLWEPAARMIRLTRTEEPPPAIPAAPLLLAPAEGGQFVNTLPWLTWEKDEESDTSRLQILSSSGIVVHAKAGLASSTYKVPTGTLTDGTYTWQASVHNEGGWSPWSSTRTFSITTVAPPAAPVLLTPADQSTVDTTVPLAFAWEPVADADRYRLRILRGEDVVWSEDGLPEGTYTMPDDSPLLGSGEYSWQAAARGIAGWSTWSSVSTFSIPRPDNGAILKRLPAFTGGRGKLTIQMGTGRDAIVKLVKSDSDQASIAVYVRADSSTTVTGIPDGVYRVVYATGEGYNAQSATFILGLKAAEFDESVAYTTTSTTYSTWSITLYAAAGGNATTTPLPGDSFGGY